MRTVLYTFAVFLGILLSFHLVAADECGQTPTDNCTISTSTTFTPGNYQVENITIIANDTVVDCNGASFTHVYGILFNVAGTTGVTIQNNPFEGVVLPILINNAVTGYSLSPEFPNHQIINNTLIGSVSGGIQIIKAANNYIADNLIDGSGAPNYNGIWLVSANNILERNTLHMAKLNLDRALGWNSTNATITENNITDVYRAIQLETGSHGAVIQDNSLENVGLGV